MQQTIRQQTIGLAIQSCWKDDAVELTMDHARANAYRLSSQQARALACALIEGAYQAEAGALIAPRPKQKQGEMPK